MMENIWLLMVFQIVVRIIVRILVIVRLILLLRSVKSVWRVSLWPKMVGLVLMLVLLL